VSCVRPPEYWARKRAQLTEIRQRRESRESRDLPREIREALWPGEALAVAKPDCSWCHGIGRRIGRRGLQVCECSWKAVCRAVLDRYRAEEADPGCPRLSLSRLGGGFAAGYRTIEFRVDVDLVARAALTPAEYRLFRLHMLGGASWGDVAGDSLGKKSFFDDVYRIQVKLGRALTAYGLYPTHRYFAGARLAAAA